MGNKWFEPHTPVEEAATPIYDALVADTDEKLEGNK